MPADYSFSYIRYSHGFTKRNNLLDKGKNKFRTKYPMHLNIFKSQIAIKKKQPHHSPYPRFGKVIFYYRARVSLIFQNVPVATSRS